MQTPAVFNSRFPPSEETFRGVIMTRLASGGAEVGEVIDDFTGIAEAFADYFPDEPPVSPSEVAAVVDEVVAEHRRVVTSLSPDAAGLMKVLDDLHDADILYSFGDAFDDEDAQEYVREALEYVTEAGGKLRGYLYSTIQDLDRMVLEQVLQVSFGVFGPGPADAIAREAVGVFAANGLAASWSGAGRIVIEPIIIDAPLVDDEDEADAEPHDHSH
jgi:hypothetical protein